MTDLPKQKFDRWRYPLPGGGPWRILVDCPAPIHNSTRAARGGTRLPSCVCPKARERLAEMRVSERGRQRVMRKATASIDRKSVKQTYMNNVKEGASQTAPFGGLCSTDDGRRLMDHAATRQLGSATAAVRAKALCQVCPIELSCLAWALEYELPRGAWGGVIGGLTAAERAKV